MKTLESLETEYEFARDNWNKAVREKSEDTDKWFKAYSLSSDRYYTAKYGKPTKKWNVNYARRKQIRAY